MRKTSRFLALVTLLFASPVFGFQFDHDSLDDCKERAEAGQCIQDSVTFFKCAASCTDHYKIVEPTTRHGYAKNPDAFYELEATTISSKTISFDQFEGYVTVVAIVPILPGMANYYHELLEHVQSIFPYTVELMIFPVRREGEEASSDVHLAPKPGSKVLVMKELSKVGEQIEAHPVLEYLEMSIDPNAKGVVTDRVTIYIVNYAAILIEKRISPRIEFLENMISFYLKEMKKKPEF